RRFLQPDQPPALSSNEIYIFRFPPPCFPKRSGHCGGSFSVLLNVGQKLETLAIVLREIKEQVAPELQELRTELQTAWQTLKEELTKDVQEVGAQIQPLVRKLRENVQQDATAYFQQLRTISQDFNQIAQEKLRPMAEDFRDKVRSHVDEFRKDATPYAKKLEQLIQEKAKVLEQRAVTELTEQQARTLPHPVWLQVLCPLPRLFSLLVCQIKEKQKMVICK
uniref:Apolipoprotein A-I n=1 Tax=Laticauda laticaudata TaxID=8630 RepID=A0A8C5S1Z0_LATLA